MRFFLFLFCLIAFSPRARANVYVGNGGEGVRINGKIYLRDLFDTGSHLGIVFGEATNDRILSKLNRSNVGITGVPLNLLARKLTDIQGASPELGIYLAEAIKYFRWVLLDESFLPVPEDGSPIRADYLPLANRLQNVIRIQKSTWDQMPEEQKVALVIHEAVYSILLPECDSHTGDCRQEARQAREIVSVVFMDPHAELFALTPRMERALAIPLRDVRESCDHGRTLFEISIKGSPMFRLEGKAAPEARWEFVRAACLKAAEQGFSPPMIIRMLREPFYLREESYFTSSGGIRYQQLFLRFFPARRSYAPWKFVDWHPSFASCLQKIDETATSWFNYEPATLGRQPFLGCTTP